MLGILGMLGMLGTRIGPKGQGKGPGPKGLAQRASSPFCSTNRLLQLPQIPNFPFVQQIDFSRFLKLPIPSLFNKSIFPESSNSKFPLCSNNSTFPDSSKSRFTLLFNKFTFHDASSSHLPFCSTNRLFQISQTPTPLCSTHRPFPNS